MPSSRAVPSIAASSATTSTGGPSPTSPDRRLRAGHRRLHPYRSQASARPGAAQELRLRRHRPRHPLRLSGDPSQPRCRDRRRLPQALPRPLPASRPHHPHRQWQRVHRPLRRRHEGQAARPAFRPPPLRPRLRRTRHRPPPHQTLPAADQRHGRTLQPPHRRSHRQPNAAIRNAGKIRFDSHDERDAFLLGFVQDYNRTRLKCLDYLAPLEALANLRDQTPSRG